MFFFGLVVEELATKYGHVMIDNVQELYKDWDKKMNVIRECDQWQKSLGEIELNDDVDDGPGGNRQENGSQGDHDSQIVPT